MDKGNTEWTKDQIRSWLARLDPEIAYVNLEPGFGLLFAEILCAANIPYRVVQPDALPASTYTLDEERQSARLLRQATATMLLPQKWSIHIWLESQTFIIENCDLLFVLASEGSLRGEDWLSSHGIGLESLRAALFIYPADRLVEPLGHD